ncbi:MAG TPA: type II toxin-antitoxin system HipA family toxin [Gemmatimonas aurantiaca]|uniref:Type II toxin-antitoxin system HipA family toxin n=1 Tax=Gemmatimonas aurantiaca TaxID=173480 RepID=A0A3D4V7H8_9BACT|nr:type II toxin-antitoxin system HipA family toxin [Gemmatimonas aurantiaca]HCT56784.1 type II toxin-antitoxin system HipA family toxin [Gemmatimonas aurantiaca]
MTGARTAARRASGAALATVRLWGHDVGVVAEDPSTGTVIFEYTEGFRTTGLEISPRHLPLHRRGPITFPELARSDAFLGLPGVLADSLPDAYGNAVIRRYFEQRGRPQDAMSPVQRLLYIGQRAMGALEFTPPIDAVRNDATKEALEISMLVEQARRVIEGDTSVAIPEMMQVGATAGGARAKALILWNRAVTRVRSGFAPATVGDEHWMIKFDGVAAGEGGHSVTRNFQPQPYGRIEYAYSQMARRAGIDMSETHLLRERDFAHFMTRRFDRVQRGVSLATAAEQETSVSTLAAAGTEPMARLHMHTLGGLEHTDYNVRQLLSYEDWFRTIRALQLGQAAIDQAYRRMVFNLAARNQDDHVKNIAFLMDDAGHWSLAPAYDLTWAVGGTWTRTHQMTVRGKDDHFTRGDLLQVGKAFDVPDAGARIVDDIEEGLALWESSAKAVDLDRHDIDERARLFRHFA